jgi:hypothetical protein
MDLENFDFGQLEDLGREQVTDENKRIDLWIETRRIQT